MMRRQGDNLALIPQGIRLAGLSPMNVEMVRLEKGNTKEDVAT